ncbi:hypothetical protein FFWV33_15280 [Flavobacterium faecale]|uniref:DUF6896 domain-containing protein n=1 Tax=Flavobacterium faecale TaxID=1355330 RepID=A0A2S1LGB7_9FLAO|nr:hypothetical protein [Flavobacterium faecale]AWG22793.1 hypothetical protein FFWV33_15280 [Flavobacterium faecale]
MQELKLLIEVIQTFEKKANEMIKVLALEFNLDLNSERIFDKLISKQNNLRRGNLKDNWTYWFHGDACDFENKETNQYLHIKINRNGNYGAIDNFYLYKFLQTSESLKSIYEVINSEKYMNELLEKLFKTGILINIDEFPLKTIILKKE